MTIILQILKKLPLKVPLSAVEGRFEVTFLSKALFYRDLRKRRLKAFYWGYVLLKAPSLPEHYYFHYRSVDFL